MKLAYLSTNTSMKLTTMKTAIVTSFILVLTISTVFAVGNNSNSEEVLILKAKAKAENTREGDWRALAECAKTLLDQRINCEDELNWLQKSLSINENYYNLTLLGDYYRLNRDFTRAYENYIKAILSAQKDKKMEVIPDIQWKVLITMGTKNYYEFQEKQANN
jgi:hypothetical protein